MVKRVLALGVVLMVVFAGVVAFSFLKPPKEASGPIEAIPVDLGEPESVEQAVPEPASEIAPTAGGAITEARGPGLASEAAATAAPAAAADASADPVIFEIVQAGSEARFIIDEVLNGAPKTVVGATDQVAGQIAIFADEPNKSTIGTILVNARTLATDNEFRNRAIKNRILSTDNYEFITFTPTEIVGMPGSVSIGESIAFQIVGDLTVRETTQQVTFDATVTPISETQLEGTASTTVLYADFGLSIPQARAVASVDDKVILEIDFVAVAN